MPLWLCGYVLPAILALASASSLVQALEYNAGSLTITDPWVRAPQGGAQAGGGLAITNTGSAPDHLLGGTASGATRVEVHMTSHEGGTAQMRPVEGGVEIKPGETIRLAPGGRHLMFIGLKQSLSEGEQVEGTLQFKNAGTVPVKFEVQAATARAPANPMNRH
jgi:periplasmic copper chaperone A